MCWWVLGSEEVHDQFPSFCGDSEDARICLERDRIKLEILREQNRFKELSVVSYLTAVPYPPGRGQPWTSSLLFSSWL